MVTLQIGVGIVGDLDARCQTVVDLVTLEPGMALRADQNPCLGVTEDLILLKDSYMDEWMEQNEGVVGFGVDIQCRN